MTVTPLPIVADKRLDAWHRWSDNNGLVYEAPNWNAAATRFFSDKFSDDSDPMFRASGDWEVVSMADHTGRLYRGKNADLVWKFIEREKGKFGVKLVGTVEV